jgi:hypothetical protein
MPCYERLICEIRACTRPCTATAAAPPNTYKQPALASVSDLVYLQLKFDFLPTEASFRRAPLYIFSFPHRAVPRNKPYCRSRWLTRLQALSVRTRDQSTASAISVHGAMRGTRGTETEEVRIIRRAVGRQSADLEGAADGCPAGRGGKIEKRGTTGSGGTTRTGGATWRRTDGASMIETATASEIGGRGVKTIVTAAVHLRLRVRRTMRRRQQDASHTSPTGRKESKCRFTARACSPPSLTFPSQDFSASQPRSPARHDIRIFDQADCFLRAALQA